MSTSRTIAGDWYPGIVPPNVELDDTAYVESTYSFHLYRSAQPVGLRFGRGASAYLGTMFDVGAQGRVTLGDYVLVNGARIVCDAEITIGDYTLISWNVVIMDTYRIPLEATARRREVRRVPERDPRRLEDSEGDARPVRIGRNVWIGFDVCVLPGACIGEGAIIGARSVVAGDVEPFTIVGGNPARFVRRLTPTEVADGR